MPTRRVTLERRSCGGPAVARRETAPRGNVARNGRTPAPQPGFSRRRHAGVVPGVGSRVGDAAGRWIGRTAQQRPVTSWSSRCDHARAGHPPWFVAQPAGPTLVNCTLTTGHGGPVPSLGSRIGPVWVRYGAQPPEGAGGSLFAVSPRRLALFGRPAGGSGVLPTEARRAPRRSRRRLGGSAYLRGGQRIVQRALTWVAVRSGVKRAPTRRSGPGLSGCRRGRRAW